MRFLVLVLLAGCLVLHGELQQVRALSGSSQQVELPCLVDQANCGEVYYITWTRQSNGTALSWQRVYLYTGANDSAPHKPTGELLHRARFVMPEKSALQDEWPNQQQQQQPMARLVIEEPRLADDGLYKCDVTYVKGKCPSISLVRLQVMQLPEKALIVQPEGRAPDNQDGRTVGPYNEGQQLRLTCLVHGGRPAPSALNWRKIDASGRTINLAGSLMVASQRRSGQSQVELQLNHTLSSVDLGAKFECHVEHEALERPPAIVASQPSTDSSPSPDALLDLHPATNQVQQPAAAGGKSLDSHVYLDLNVGVASLDLLMSKLGGSQARSANSSLDSLQEGDLIELECVAYNSRPAANISWFNGQEPIEPLDPFGSTTTALPVAGGQPRRHKRLLQRHQVHPNPDGQTYNTHSFLSLKLSRHEHRAQISCQALNGQVMRQPLTKSIELQVQHAPIVLMEPAGGIVLNEPATSDIGGQDVIQQSASIYCIYSANPSQLLANSTRWFKDGQPLALGDPRYSETTTPTGYPMLSISQVQRRDAGLYECQLSNAVGISEHLPASENCRLEVNFRPSTQLRLYKPPAGWTGNAKNTFQPADLSEVDLGQELVLPGGSYILVCDVLEAQPAKINRFHWFQRRSLPASQMVAGGKRLLVGRPSVAKADRLQPLENQSSQLLLASLTSNFTPSAFVCAASNSLGVGESSNQIELRLSYQPGPSHVKLVKDAALRKKILASGKPAHSSQTSSPTEGAAESDLDELDSSPVHAGSELLLQCITPDLGLPRANIWLWFKDGHPIESHPPLEHQQTTNPSNLAHKPIETNEDDDAILNSNNNNDRRLLSYESISSSSDNPITSSDKELSATSYIASSTFDNRKQNGPGRLQRHNQRLSQQQDIRLIGLGSYLHIPSIQLVHKGNYSCVAVNRLGSGHQQSSANGGQQQLRDLILNVVLAPSFVQPLASRTYWPEVSADSSSVDGRQLELVCHVQCEPICQIEWLRNNEPLDLRRQSESLSSNYLAYQMKQSIMDENLEANMFKSIESRLVFRFHKGESLTRDKILERRAILSGANYTCQSSPNYVGPPVRSTTKFIVQYPPENLLINTPSDKLNLVEGSNGPRLSCEASAEPQVQFRWFMLPTKDSINNDFSRDSTNNLSDIKSNSKRSSPTQLSGFGNEREAINQVASKAFDTVGGGANDLLAVSNPEHLIELTGSATEQLTGAVSTSVSTLDLSSISLDRKQAGHYFCEASNRLGIVRQSVYLNVLYKPTCATLHLHSLDVTIAPSWDDLRKEPYRNQADVDDNNQITRTKPLRATVNDEYSIVRETSEDFIDLRKILILSPLLNRYPSAEGSESGEELSFKGSIFQTIMNDKRLESENEGRRTSATKQIKEIRDKNALTQLEDKGDNRMAENLPISNDSHTRISDSWDKFNVILLKFLNNYMRQVKNYEEQMMEVSNNERTNKELRDRRQNRRSSMSSQDEAAVRTNSVQSPLLGNTKNLLTFACMPQDANPMSNLTFEWHFGLTNLPETGSESTIDEAGSVETPNHKPILIYANENYTIQIMLVRRLDTRSSLNPFQMSLLTLNVVIEQLLTLSGPERPIEVPTTPDNLNKTGPLKMPVLRSRYQSTFHGARASQFKHEFDSATKPHNSEVNEQNWQEQIGNLLKCTITNQIGTSDACHVRVNVAERLKSQSSSLEFAKWRMPSLAHKSLLIISILIGCGTIVFVAATLLAGPFIRRVLLKQDESVTGSGAENNTGQSTSSQKSSVLGLLGNGDSSTQGSSDDDSSGRLHHHQHHHLRHANNHHTVDERTINRSMRLEDVSTSSGFLNQQKLMTEPSANYDQPRGISESRSVYHNGNFNEGSFDVIGDSSLNSYDYTIGLANARLANVVGPSSSSKASCGSTGSRLLANLGLKSLSKFKVDRISDLTNFAAKNLHTKNISNTETNTTGLSVSVLDNEHSMKLASTGGQSPAFFSESATLHTNKRSLPQQHLARPNTSYYLFDQNGLYSDTDSQMMQLNSRRLINTATTIMPTYSNMGSNAMDEFLKQRGIDFSPSQVDEEPTFFRSQSIRTSHPYNQQGPYLTSVNDYSHFQRMDQIPQVRPRSQHQTMSMYRSQAQDLYKPPVAARATQAHQLSARSGYAPVDNRFFISSHSHLLPPSSYLNTIDSHLNSLAGTAGIAHYQDQNRGPSMAYANPIDSRDGLHNAEDKGSELVHKSSEHIYDSNAYATPEQTPLRGQNNNSTHQAQLSTNSERPPVSQLIQTFNSKIPE